MNPLMERVLIRWNDNCSREKYRLNFKLLYQDLDWQTSSALSYHPSPAHSNHLHQPLGQPPNPHHYQFSHQIINTLNKSGSNSKSMNIDSLKKQSSAIQSYSAAVKRAADAPQVLSICRSCIYLRHWFQSKEPSASLSFASGKRSNESEKKNNEAKSVCEKTTITATSAGFYFNHSKVDCVSFLIDFNCEFSTSIVNFQPSPDPRYPCQNQV